MAASSAAASSSWALEPNRSPAPGFSAEASYSSSSRAAEARPVSCEGAGEEDMLDLDSPWVAATEAESRLEEAVAGLNLTAEEEAGEDEIRDNQQRQEDELMALQAIFGDDLVVFENKGGLPLFPGYNLNDGVEVCAKLSSPNGNPKDGECSDGVEGHGDEPAEF